MVAQTVQIGCKKAVILSGCTVDCHQYLVVTLAPLGAGENLRFRRMTTQFCTFDTFSIYFHERINDYTFSKKTNTNCSGAN